MNGERLAGLLNDVSRGKGMYSFEENSNKIIAISKDGFGEILSIEKAMNELKLLSVAMLEILKDIFMEIVEDEPAGESNGNRNRPEREVAMDR